MMKSNYPNSTIQRLLNVGMKRWLYSMLLILLSASSALASHYRYGVVTATRLSETGTTVTYRLNVSEAWRLGTAGTNTTFSISGGNTGTVSVPMTVVTDPSGQWSNGAGNTTLTLNKSTTPTTIRFTGCCKISTIVNNHDLSWDEHIILNTGAPGSSPVSTMPAIINMPVNAPSATYAIPATDPDPGSTLTFGTPAFTGNLAGQSNPSGFSINSTTGVITLNTVGKSIGQQYNALVTVQDQDGNRIMMDFLINMVGASTPPVFDYTVTPTNGAVYNVMVGQNVSFPIKATDGDANSTVSLSVAGLPSYITTSNFTNNALPATGNPSLTTFSWTPGAGQIGSTNVLNFIATDNVGVQTTSSVTIKVVAEPAPVFVNPTAAQGSVRQIETGQLFVDTVVAQSSLGSNVSIAFATGIPNNATQAPAIPTAGANPGQSILSWNPTPAQFGVRTLSYQATIAAYPTIFATRSFQIIVNTTPSFTSTPVTSVTVGQTYSYNVTVSDPNIPYGDTVDIIGASIPSWLTLVSTGNGTAVLSGTPTAANAGTYEIALEAEDIYHHGTNSHVHQHFDLEVLLPATITAVGNTTICQGSSVQLNANTGTGLTYQWKKDGDVILGATSATYVASVSGSYTVVVTLSGVSSTSNAVVVTVNPSVSITNCPQTQYQQIYADSNSCSTLFSYTPTITGANTVSYAFTGATIASGSGTGSGSIFNVGQTTVTINATGDCGSASCSFVVTVVDNKAPKAITKNATIYLNATGTASITPADINDGSNDNCGPVTLSLSQTGTICGFATEGQNVTLSAPAGAVITSIDFASYGTPNGSCGNYLLGWCHATNSKSIVESYALNQNTVTIPASNGVFGDPCGGTVKRLYIQATWTGNGSSTTFNCAKVGANTVNLVVTDANGNVSTAPATVTVIDTIKPNAVAQNVTVNLGANGTGSVTAAQVNNGSSDNCSISNMTLSKTNFSCADLTFNTISQVIPSNTSWSLSSVVTPYVGTCGTPFNGVSSLPAASTFSLTPILNGYVSNIIPGTDALFAENDVRYFKKSFYLSSLNDVSAEFLASVDNTVQIWINGVAVALEKDIDGANFNDNIYHRLILGSNGVNTNGGVGYQSFDVVNAVSASSLFVVGNNEIVLAVANCPAPDRGNISFKATITNKAPSTIPVTLTVSDPSSNVSSVGALVTVVDNIAPVITCPSNISVYATSAAGATVNYSIPTATDNCSATVSLVSGLASGSTFPIGVSTVKYKAQDQSGNSVNCSFTVTVSGVAPVIVSPGNITVNNDVNVCGANVNYTATETTGIPASTITYSIAPGSSFATGTTQVTTTATNAVGTSSATFTVTVVDNQTPSAVAQNVTINLDANGAASTTASAVNNGSSDNCGIASISLSKTSFDCSNVGSNNVTLTVTDVNGNVSTASAVVTVVDAIAPTAVAQNVTINLDANGAASTTASAVNNGSSDNCGIASIALSKTSFDCSNVGSNNVTLTVTDVNGNVSTASAVVTVVDAIAPTALAQNVTINLDASGAASTTASAVNNGSSDNCGIASIALSKTSFNCSNVGTNNVTLTVTDVNGNVSTASAVVTVVDAIAPTAVAQNVTINLDANGAASTTASAVNNGSSDNCGIASIALSKTSFDCSNVGSNNVTLTVTDVNGNVSTVSAVVTVVDAIAPTAIAQNLSLTLANGIVNITAAQVNNGSYDNCGIANMTVSPSSFNCGNIGANTVILTVTDVNGNVSTVSAVVMINGVVPSCTVASSPRTNGPVIGGTTTYAAPNQMFLGYGPQTMNITCTATGAGPFTYSWSGVGLSNYTIPNPIFAPTSAGNFTLTCTITNAYGCQSTCSITICVINAVGPGGSPSNPKVLLCHYPPGNTNNPQTLSIALSAVTAHLGLHGGDKLGSCNATCGLAKNGTDGEMYTEETIYGEVNLVVYPNPSNSSFNFRLESSSAELVTLKLYDMSGREVLKLENQNPAEVITVAQDMAPGVYMATVVQGDFVKTVKITKVN